MMRKLQQNKGFTLVELTIAIALYSFLLLIVLGGFLGVFWIFNKVATANKVQQDARNSIDVITRATRFANGADTVPSQNPNDTTTKGLCVSGANGSGNVKFYRALIKDTPNPPNHVIYQESTDKCDDAKVPDPNDPNQAPTPTPNNNLILLTSKNLDVRKFEPTMLDNKSSVELIVDMASGVNVTPTTAIDRFESYVSFQTVVNVRSYRGQ